MQNQEVTPSKPSETCTQPLLTKIQNFKPDTVREANLQLDGLNLYLEQTQKYYEMCVRYGELQDQHIAMMKEHLELLKKQTDLTKLLKRNL